MKLWAELRPSQREEVAEWEHVVVLPHTSVIIDLLEEQQAGVTKRRPRPGARFAVKKYPRRLLLYHHADDNFPVLLMMHSDELHLQGNPNCGVRHQSGAKTYE